MAFASLHLDGIKGKGGDNKPDVCYVINAHNAAMMFLERSRGDDGLGLFYSNLMMMIQP